MSAVLSAIAWYTGAKKGFFVGIKIGKLQGIEMCIAASMEAAPDDMPPEIRAIFERVPKT